MMSHIKIIIFLSILNDFFCHLCVSSCVLFSRVFFFVYGIETHFSSFEFVQFKRTIRHRLILVHAKTKITFKFYHTIRVIDLFNFLIGKVIDFRVK